MLRLLSVVLISLALLGSANAQGDLAPVEGEGFDAVVLGLAVNDLLNVREQASPMSRTQGRLANGALVRQYQCESVNGYDWCRVDAAEEGIKGWAPRRYLQPLNVDEVLQPLPQEASAPELPPIDSIMGELPPPLAPAGPPVPTPAPRETAEAAPAAQEEAVPVDAAEPVVDESETGPADKGGRLAGERLELPAGIEERFAEGASVPLDKVRTAEGASAGASEPTVVVPCARYVGEPMKSCIARVASQGEGQADVTVLWPDGGSRVIRFRDGVAAGSNSREEFRFTREGSLNMIRIGTSERFEILDSIALDG
jgi:hypothetical protein